MSPIKIAEATLGTAVLPTQYSTFVQIWMETFSTHYFTTVFFANTDLKKREAPVG